ncbi:MAG: Nif3-like dinuclear metal center hexameric protein [Oscillospiraceae bacterium]|nr:Nif3-like dinuclear metal center hexameric protein [Oscillospiraceae bacterium]
MPAVRDIETALFSLAPRELAMKWDNVGLLVGECEKEVHHVLIALDVTEAVAEEARQTGAELIAAHHPVMNCHWSPVQSLRNDTLQGHLLRKLVRDGTSVICMHTNLDAAQGGVNDALAQRLGLEQTEIMEGGEGIVRMGLLPEPMPVSQFLELVRKRLRPNGIRYVEKTGTVQRVAVGGGACGEYFEAAVREHCDAFVTADLKYNQFLDAGALGLCLVDAGHFPTEDVVCSVLEQFLTERFPDLKVTKASSHWERIQYYV